MVGGLAMTKMIGTTIIVRGRFLVLFYLPSIFHDFLRMLGDLLVDFLGDFFGDLLGELLGVCLGTHQKLNLLGVWGKFWG